MILDFDGVTNDDFFKRTTRRKRKTNIEQIFILIPFQPYKNPVSTEPNLNITFVFLEFATLQTMILNIPNRNVKKCKIKPKLDA